MLGLCGNAYAGATATIDGVTFPIGIVPGGNQVQSGILDETLITGSGQTLQSIGIVNTIDSGLNQVWDLGQNGVELAFVVNNYVSNIATLPNVTFTGGTVSYYVLNAGTDITAPGTIAGDIALIESGKLFLSFNAAPEDAAGDTLISSITTGSSLSAFTAASGNGFLDVTGGDAGLAFATQTFANVYDTANGGFSDVTLTSDFTTGGAASPFQISGSATVKANAIPEPLSMAMLGIGLVGIGAVRRRAR